MIPVENQELYNMLSLIATFVFGFAVKHYGDMYLSSKNKISNIRKLIDTVDDALVDDSVNEDEFRKIFNAAKEVIQK
jgi:sensor histidine kinase YesM